MTLTQRFAELRAVAGSLGGSRLDESVVELAMTIAADVVGVDVVDLMPNGKGAVIIVLGSGHRIVVEPPEAA